MNEPKLDGMTQHCCTCVGCTPKHWRQDGCVCGGAAEIAHYDCNGPHNVYGDEFGTPPTRRCPRCPDEAPPAIPDEVEAALVLDPTAPKYPPSLRALASNAEDDLEYLERVATGPNQAAVKSALRGIRDSHTAQAREIERLRGEVEAWQKSRDESRAAGFAEGLEWAQRKLIDEFGSDVDRLIAYSHIAAELARREGGGV